MAALTPPEPSSRYGTHRCRRLRHRGIRVNTVVPGYTETPLVTSISGHAAERAAVVSRIPLGRPGRPEDIEGIMVYLASDDPATPPVVLFRVDGGMTAL